MAFDAQPVYLCPELCQGHQSHGIGEEIFEGRFFRVFEKFPGFIPADEEVVPSEGRGREVAQGEHGEDLFQGFQNFTILFGGLEKWFFQLQIGKIGSDIRQRLLLEEDILG